MEVAQRSFSRAQLAVLTLSWVLLNTWQVHGFIPGAFVALVPFTLGVVGAGSVRSALAVALGGGSAFFVAAQFFLAYYSWKGLAVLALWQGLTILPVALALRCLYSRWRIPLAFCLPVAWVGGEFLRNQGPLALPTGMLMAPLYKQLWLIQVCDLAGVYGLNAALAMINGLLADRVFAWHKTSGQEVFRTHPRWIRTALAGTVSVWLFIPAYGWFRLREARSTMHPGPVVSVVQPDIPYRSGIQHGFDPEVYLEEMLALNKQAVASQPAPSLILWPESLSTMPPLNTELLNAKTPLPDYLTWRRDEGKKAAGPLRDWVARSRTPLLLGTLAWLPPPTPPGPWLCFNSAMMLTPDGHLDAPRQFKQRLFPGGEQIPFRGTFLNRWLRSLLTDDLLQPGAVSQLEPGERRDVFTLLPGGYRYIMNICYEILFANSSGVFLSGHNGEKPFDFLFNISNDGVFQRSAGQMVHWRVLPFRAVEARVGIARAANTGISGFVKPSGEIYGEVKNARGQIWTGLGAPELLLIADVVKRRERETEILANPADYHRLTTDVERIRSIRAEAGVTGQSTQPIFIDTRRTIYSRTGDVVPPLFLITMFAATFAAILGSRR